MLVLERLSPLERASILLHDVFGLDFAEVARTLDRGEAACRQLAARAREHVQAERPRFSRLARGGRAVWRRPSSRPRRSGDTRGTERSSSPKTSCSTATAAANAPRRSIRSTAPTRCCVSSKALRARAPSLANDAGAYRYRQRPAGFVLREDNGSLDTMAFEHRDGRIVAIYITRNPDKLQSRPILKQF